MPVTPRNSGKRYVPLLKTKASELTALKNLTLQQAQGLTPLLELHALKPLTDQNSLDKFTQKLTSAWPYEAPVYIDAGLAAGALASTLSPSPCQAFFSALVQAGLKVIPVTDPYRAPVYQAAVAQTAQAVGLGICLRIETDWITAEAPLQNDIPTFCTGLSIPHNYIDVILDQADIKIAQNMVTPFVPWLVTVLNWLGALTPWRAMTLAGASFPQIIPAQAGTVLSIPRIEWRLWDQLLNAPGLTQMPNFGDYTCHAAKHMDIPVYALANAACKLRYTTDLSWIAIKGQSVQAAGADQYYALAAQIRSHPAFCGPAFCFGDDYIATRAARNGTTGGHQQWLTADINHHMAYVVAQM